MSAINVVEFAPSGWRTFRPEFVLYEGRTRRQWAVIERSPDGSEEVWSVAHGRRSEAFAMAEILTRGEARRRRDLESLRSHPLGNAILCMTRDQREFMIKLLTGAQHLMA